jgi:hypothetical protein
MSRKNHRPARAGINRQGICMSRKHRGSDARFHRVSTLAAAVALAGVGAPAQGFEFSSDSGEIWGSFDTTLSLGARWRMEKPDPSLIGIANRDATPERRNRPLRK